MSNAPLPIGPASEMFVVTRRTSVAVTPAELPRVPPHTPVEPVLIAPEAPPPGPTPALAPDVPAPALAVPPAPPAPPVLWFVPDTAPAAFWSEVPRCGPVPLAPALTATSRPEWSEPPR